MAAGSYDPGTGIWLHGEDDAYPTFSERLNKGQQSVIDALNTLGKMVCIVEPVSASAQTIPNATDTYIEWATAPIIPAPFAKATLQGLELDAGVYDLRWQVGFAANTTGRRAADLMIGSERYTSGPMPPVSGAGTVVTGERVVRLPTKTLVRVLAYQNSGGNLGRDLFAHSTSFTATRRGPA